MDLVRHQELGVFQEDLRDEDLPGMYLEAALIGAVYMVEDTVKKVCHPGAFFASSAFFPEVDPSGVKGVWESVIFWEPPTCRCTGQ